ncbi:hypothetical protein CPLU01_15206 [Colletotrichum plurivorum]|uniref:F-box domain-containing protein n=1 Tax=Colletotrichum plurivorum TaxID=2175906 RepID=A0A8H6JDZ7_9PEZI|nr:hypothetical protein CPLU01_15206 [Colletotrichum plurivorum]
MASQPVPNQPVPNLDHLPTEVLERIFFSIADLRSIYHLVTASPTASSVFESSEAGPKILHHVLGQSMSPHVVDLVRLVGLVRISTPGCPPAPSLEAFVERYTRCRDDRGSRFVPAPSLSHTLRDQPPHLVRGVLLTARRICCLTWACLDFYRDSWSSVTPSHVDVAFGWGAGYQKPWRQEVPPGKPYNPQPLGPPCWMEEQRVMRGFWRLQLLIDLKRAASEKRLDWALEEVQLEISPEILFAPWTWQEEEFLTVVDFIDHFHGGSILTVRCHCLTAPPANYASASEWQDPAVPGVIDRRWSREEISKGRPPCWGFYWVNLRHTPFSPIRGCPFWPYRQLGLAIWEGDKLEALELAPRAFTLPRKPSSWGNPVFTWRSLLSQQLIAQLVSDMEEGFQKNGFSFGQRNPDM